MTFIEKKECRVCGSNNCETYLDLGAQPPSNSFILPTEISKEQKYPLAVMLCLECSLSQLTGVVAAEEIFTDYLYVSSVSKALVRHYQGLIDGLLSRFKLQEKQNVLDIGANDGIMLDRYPAQKFNTIGVEPSQLSEVAQKKGHKIYRQFFNRDVAKKIFTENGPIKVLTATNVFAHIDDIHSVVEGIKILFNQDSLFVIETPYVVDMVEKNYFDTIYHEHLCYWGVTSLQTLFKKHGMKIFDVERVDLGASGPAIRVFVELDNGVHAVSSIVEKMLNDEMSWGIKNIDPYKQFAERVWKTKQSLIELLKSLVKQNARVGVFGAPAKGNTLLNSFSLTPELLTEGVAEMSESKVGRLTPGSHIPIIHESEFLKKKPDYALLLTWNYADFFLKTDYIKNGGKFIVPFPTPHILPKN